MKNKNCYARNHLLLLLKRLVSRRVKIQFSYIKLGLKRKDRNFIEILDMLTCGLVLTKSSPEFRAISIWVTGIFWGKKGCVIKNGISLNQILPYAKSPYMSSFRFQYVESVVRNECGAIYRQNVRISFANPWHLKKEAKINLRLWEGRASTLVGIYVIGFKYFRLPIWIWYYSSRARTWFVLKKGLYVQFYDGTKWDVFY